MQPERRQVEVDGGGRVVDADAAVGSDLGVLGGQPRSQDRGLLDGEALKGAVRRGQRHRQRVRARGARALARGAVEDPGDRASIDGQRAKAPGSDLPPLAVVRRGGLGGRRVPRALRARGGGLGRGGGRCGEGGRDQEDGDQDAGHAARV